MVPGEEPRAALGQSSFTSAFEAQYDDGSSSSRLTLMAFDGCRAFIGAGGNVPRELKGPGANAFAGAESYHGAIVAARSGASVAIVIGPPSERAGMVLVEASLATMRGHSGNKKEGFMAIGAVHVIGVPLDLGAGHRGVDMGPSALRIAGLHRALERLKYDVLDKGDVPAPVPETRDVGDPKKKYVREIAAVCDTLCRWARASLAQSAIPLVLGGDHSLGAGSVAAAAAQARAMERPLGLLWVDAHADMNTPQTTLSGNVHGMPLSALLGEDPAELAGIGGFAPKATPTRTALVGIRNLDAREGERIAASGVHVFTMKEIDRVGIAAVTEHALALVGADGAGVHVSFDLDACDPSIAPGVGTPVKGGLDYREAHTLMEMVADSGRLTSLDLVEVNPILDIRNQTAELGVELAMSALGLRIL